jgi:hypothetical protein
VPVGCRTQETVILALPDDDWIEQFVEVERSERQAAINRQLLTETILSIDSQANKQGAFLSSARVNLCANAAADAAIEMIRCRLDAEREAHGRSGVHEVSEQRMERAQIAVEHLTGEGLDELLGAALRGAERDFMADYAPAMREIRERVEEAGRLGLARLPLDVQRPSAGQTGDTYNIHVHAPNHGVLAGRIDNVKVEAVNGGLQTALTEILEATRTLPGDQGEEAREIIDGIVTEVERGTHANGSAVRVLCRRISALLQPTANFVQVADAIGRVLIWAAA